MLYRYPGVWDLDEGLKPAPESALPDGPRTIFIKLKNALELESQAFSHTVSVDTTAPSLQATIIPAKDLYGPGDTLTIQLNAPEPLINTPTVTLGEVERAPQKISELAWELSVDLSEESEDT